MSLEKERNRKSKAKNVLKTVNVTVSVGKRSYLKLVFHVTNSANKYCVSDVLSLCHCPRLPIKFPMVL